MRVETTATGRVWGAYENSNLIERYDAGLRRAGRVAPPAQEEVDF